LEAEGERRSGSLPTGKFLGEEGKVRGPETNWKGGFRDEREEIF
jgi:hypothetical protein